MDTTFSVSIKAGELTGRATWCGARQTYGAELRLFDTRLGDSQFPPSQVRFGHRMAEFITTDILTGSLAARGLAIDPACHDNIDELNRVVTATHGEAEIVGLTSEGGGRLLFILTPARILVPINPRVDHADHALAWGDTGQATIETARLIGEQVWARSPGPELEHFALSLTHELLQDLGDDFAVGADSICGWYLTDAETSSLLGPADLLSLRRRVGLKVRPGPVPPTTRLGRPAWYPGGG